MSFDPDVLDRYSRLEPRRPFDNLDRGFRAEVHDPVWFLGRQWQMGEHQGEDASSPVSVTYTTERIALDPLPGHPNLDPKVIPPEAIVESEAGDWWTIGRRVALGRAYAVANNLPAPADGDASMLFATEPYPELPHPYDRLNGNAYDGLKLWAADSNHTVFDQVPKEPPDFWDPAELFYKAEFTAGSQNLTLERHDGGDIDWYSVDAAAPLAGGSAMTHEVIPTRMRYPGAPHPRWWQIESARVDIGGFAPDRGHFATMLLIDLMMSHSDDWFTFPVTAGVGEVVRLSQVTIRDSFDDTWQVEPPQNWSMFQVQGLQPTSLLLWPIVTSPLTGAIEEDVVLGLDEDANLLWAVETRAEGRDLPTEGLDSGEQPAVPNGPIDASAKPTYRFRASRGARPYWHPYVLQDVAGRRRFVQGRAADLSVTPPKLYPEPKARVLKDMHNFTSDPSAQVLPVHQIEPATISPTGMRLTRRWVLARATDGNPVLWVQRRRLPLVTPPESDLRFDLFEQELAIAQ